MDTPQYVNPFRPGAGHMPPYLAGRIKEQAEFQRLLEQEIVMTNLVLTGLRGLGKTVLLDTFKPVAMKAGWVWVGTDLSETTSISESRLATRILADLSPVTSTIVIGEEHAKQIGFVQPGKVQRHFDYEMLQNIYDSTPGLIADKLKSVLEKVWFVLHQIGCRGVVFAYDEAQNMQDHAAKDEYPLSVMLDVFQSIQKKGIPFMLLLTGLPTLFPKLVEARTYSERMFHVMFLDRLTSSESRDAITIPVEKLPLQMTDESVETTIEASGGYPYFIQFFCREVYDVFLRNVSSPVSIPTIDIKRKLDADFFAGRWAKASDRQRELLRVAAEVPGSDVEFTIQSVSDLSRNISDKPFSKSHISQMFTKLSECGLVFKNRHGRYSFAVPMLGEFIRRQYS